MITQSTSTEGQLLLGAARSLQSQAIPAREMNAATVGLLQSFAVLRGPLNGGRAFAFTSSRRGEGVSHVVRSLGTQLPVYGAGHVAALTVSQLRSLDDDPLLSRESIGFEFAPGFWIGGSDRQKLAVNEGPINPSVWLGLRRLFNYIFVDCGALEHSGDIFSISSALDGAVLVVCAGKATKTEVQRAAQILSATSCGLIGCLLNRRTYPIPGFIRRFL